MKTYGWRFLLFVVLAACEYAPEGENFVEVSQDVTPPIIVDRSLDLEEDTLFVWKYTRFNLNLASSNQEILGLEIKYVGQELRFESNYGSFEVNPAALTDGEYKVVANVYTRSGTGSLADRSGYEGFQFSREWTLIVETPQVPAMPVSTDIQNGFLKFSWPAMRKPYFLSYELHLTNTTNYDSYSVRINDPEQNFYVDSFFVGGMIHAQLHTYFENEFGNQMLSMTSTSYEHPAGKLYFEEDLDSLTISWDRSPFQHTTYYRFQYGEAVPVEADTSYRVKANGLGSPYRYGIGFKSIKGGDESDIYFRYDVHSLGVNHQVGHDNIIYNPALESYFLKDEMHIHRLNRDFELLSSYNYSWDYDDKVSLTFSPDNQHLYSTAHQKLIKLNTNELELVSEQALSFTELISTDIRTMKSISDRILLIGFNSCFVLYDAATSQVISQSAVLKDATIKQEQFYSVSEDGRYAAFCSDLGLMVFEIVDQNEIVLRYEDNDYYYNAIFDPKHPDQLLLNARENILLFNCASRNVERDLPGLTALKANPVNFDPLTHYLLLGSFLQKKVFVYDYDSDELKLVVTHHEKSFEFKLLNNYIITDSGYHFDISAYVD